MNRATGRAALSLGVLVLLTAVATAGAPGLVRIKSGDSLGEIAQRHGTSVKRLQALNGLTGTMIYAGEMLKVPAAAPARSTRRTAVRTYTVRSGDTLIGLAKRFATTPDRLAARNQLKGRYLLIGQRLTYVTTTTGAKARSTPTTTVGGSVSRSAALHRADLKNRSVPNKATVRQMIRSSAARHGVPASFALAVAYQESGFQQRVVSPVDAIGVMQVLPSTGRSLGRLHGRTYDLLKTSDNIEAGVTLLKDLLRATGSRERTLQGYYQGLGSISRKGVLPQTRQYVKNILLLQKRFS